MRSAFILMALIVTVSATTASASYNSSDATERARALLYGKDYPAALLAIERALAAEPHEPIALTTRGQIYTELGDYQRAMADHDLVLKMAPNDKGALTNACWVRALANSELETARQYCDRAVRRSPDLETLDTRGFLNLREGDFQAAEADYNRALKGRSKTANLLYGRGIARIHLGRLEEGQNDLEAAKKIQPDIGSAYQKRGIAP